MNRTYGKKIGLLILALLLSLLSVQSVSAVSNKATFGGSKTDYFFGSTPTQDGGYVAVGYTYSNDLDMKDADIRGDKDALLVKYDKNNQVEFISFYGGSNEDYFYDVIEDANGWLTVVGGSNSTDQDLEGLTHGKWDGIMVQYNDKGDFQTDLAIGNAGDDELRSIVEGDASYFVSGFSELDDSDEQAAKTATLYEIDLELSEYTKSTYGGSEGDVFNKVLKIEEDGLLAVGTMVSNNGDFSGQLRGSSDGMAMKIDDLGEIEWKYRYDGDGLEGFWHALQTRDGGYLLTGIRSTADNVSHGLVVKLTSEGKLQWQKTYAISSFVHFRGAAQAKDGGYVIAGYISKETSQLDGLLVKLDKSGNVVTSQTVGGSDEDAFVSIVSLLNGNYATVGGVGSEAEGYDGQTLIFDDAMFKIVVKSVKMDRTVATLKPNQTLQLRASVSPTNATNQTFSWRSSNTKIATVDRNGKVKAVKVGTVTITAISNDGGKQVTCKVTVKK